ncbi:glycoside hydrolase family 38 C-terminal domain-containing protein [Agromyces sp. G08B096]|uniref:Glycoside hydrolase family 38 C-terminal domain-containing protein n=1 Tax=Agromyces sp. G08B096 TaxID=3156399 RepID=A0AAU7W3E8_9MICO
MHDNSSLVLMRITRFVRERIAPAIHPDRRPLELSAWEVPDEPVPFETAVAAEYTPFAVGRPWGKPWGTTWFRVRGTVPPEWRDRPGTRVEVLVDLGFTSGQSGFQAEALVRDADGTIVKAIEPYNDWLPVAGDEIDLYVEAASNPDIGSTWDWKASPYGDRATAGTHPIYTLRAIDVALLDREVWELDRDVWTLLGLYGTLPPQTPRSAEILRALERAVDRMDPDDVAGTAAAGRAELAEVLARPAAASAHRVSAVGHAHIDSAWLWPTRETVRKCARTFSNVLQLMEEHPDFVFACSSAQQYAWMKEFYPALFERIAERVREGRFVPVGGMWVESDTNLPGGEALARQFVAGKGFFLREFGVEPTEVWLPDSFGYSAAMPQIARAAGADHFLTQKLSWNETNVMPHHTFEWEGIDGTRIFTHFPPVDTYNSDLSPAELARAERQYAEKGAANSSLVPFGYGDGGGGPTREMLAAAERAADLEGSPVVRVESPRAFFEAAREEYPAPPVWAGELYLEFHRGTYTSQARTKRGNRRSEHLLREAELWATTAAVRAGAAYPYDELDRIWQSVLLKQFHDILPGSSIAWVHQQAEAEYAELAAELVQLIGASLTAVVPVSPDDSAQLAANASPYEIDGVPPLGIGVPGSLADAVAEREDDGFVLRNDRVVVRFDRAARIVSFIDLADGREYVAPGGAAAELQLFRDTPNQWDAWDVDVHYRRHGSVIDDVQSVDLRVEHGSARLVVERRFGASGVRQEFSLRGGGSPTVDLVVAVDWHERQKLLKLAYPIDVRSDRATSEIQFGHVHRPTHENTSWDAARFETSAHRWVHVGEPGAGVAVANDSTYGHDITRHPRAGGGSMTLVRQSLLRAPVFPDPEADQGVHVLRSAITVGAGIPDAVREGYRLNLPLRPAGASAGAARGESAATLESAAPGMNIAPILVVDHPAIVVEAVKLAEDRSGDVVVRLYEAHGGRARGTVVFDFPVAAIEQTDLLERPMTPTAVRGTADARAELELRPFELVTLRVRRR